MTAEERAWELALPEAPNFQVASAAPGLLWSCRLNSVTPNSGPDILTPGTL